MEGGPDSGLLEDPKNQQCWTTVLSVKGLHRFQVFPHSLRDRPSWRGWRGGWGRGEASAESRIEMLSVLLKHFGRHDSNVQASIM